MVQPKVKDLYRWARYRAEQRGLEFNLEPKDIVIPMYCPILGFELQFNKGVARYNSPTLDRKDNNKGYDPDNVWVISQLANSMKNSANVEQLLAFSAWVEEMYGQPKKIY